MVTVQRPIKGTGIIWGVVPDFLKVGVVVDVMFVDICGKFFGVDVDGVGGNFFFLVFFFFFLFFVFLRFSSLLLFSISSFFLILPRKGEKWELHFDPDTRPCSKLPISDIMITNVLLAHQNRTIAIAGDFRVDGAKSPETPQRGGFRAREIAARNRKSLVTFHRTFNLSEIAMQHCIVFLGKR